MKPRHPNPFNVTHGIPPRRGYVWCKRTEKIGGAVERVLQEHGRYVHRSNYFGSVYVAVPNELIEECLAAIKEVQSEIDAHFRRINNLADDWKPPGVVWNMPDEDDYGLIR